MTLPVLLFDLDGTLIDSEPGILECLKETLVEYGRAIPEDDRLREFIGPPIGNALFKMLNLKDESEIPQAVATYRKYYGDHGVLNCRLYDGIRDLLDQLFKLHYQMFIVTSKARVYAELIANHHQIRNYLLGVYGPELTGTQQPKSASIEQVLREFQISSGDCVMIGDRENDITAAKVHAIKTLGVLWGYGSREELLEAGATEFVETPGKILNWLNAG